MSQEFENEPTDEQLDAMLRDVSIPSELKPQLKQIATSSPVSEQDECSPQTFAAPVLAPASASFLPYALAASLLLAVTAFTAAKFLPGDSNSTEPISIASTGGQSTEIERAQPALDQQDLELQILQAEVQALEIARLESELLRLEERYSNQLSQDEVASMILALATEYTVPLGGNEEDLRSEMARVLKDYPDTRGAVLANNILNRID